MAPLLTRKAVVLAGIEAVYNVEETLAAATDAILVEEPDYQVAANILQRNFARPSLSPLAHQVGRKLATLRFTTELRGNGIQQSGQAADAPIITRLFCACGYALTGMAAAEASSMFDVGDHANKVSWAVDDASVINTDVIAYYLEVTTGGASGVAEITVTSDTSGEGVTAAVVTSGAAFTIGASGLEATPTFTGDLVQGDRWTIWLLPTGVRLDPISAGFESLTLHVYFDGMRHKLTGCHGTFTINGEAGDYAKVQWEFTGQYVAPDDVALPSGTYETTLPAMVELARLRLDDFSAVVAAFSFTQNNDIQPRSDVNASDGYDGVRIIGRAPEMGVDPEAALVASHDFWGRLATGRRMPFQTRIGTTAGNTVWLLAPVTQYGGLTYRDRTGIRVYDAGLNPSQYAGDDEMRFAFV